MMARLVSGLTLSHHPMTQHVRVYTHNNLGGGNTTSCIHKVKMNLMFPFLSDEQVQDVLVGWYVVQNNPMYCFSILSIDVALKQFVVGRVLQVKLADQKVCLKQPGYNNK